MSKYDKYKESAFTHEEMQPMIIETDMTDVFDDLAKAFKAGHDAGRSEAADEIERLRERCTYFYEALHDIALGAHGNDGVEFARKAIGFIKLEFDADKIAAANDLINRAALREKE